MTIKPSVQHSGGRYRTVNKIDLSGYSMLYFNGSMVGSHKTLYIWSGLGETTGDYAVLSLNQNISSSAYAIDISSLNGSSYIGWFVYNISLEDAITLNQLWLE